MTEHDDLLRKFSKQIDPPQVEPDEPQAESPSPARHSSSAAPTAADPAVAGKAKGEAPGPVTSRIETAMAGEGNGFTASDRPQGGRKLTMVLLGLVLLAALGGFFLLHDVPDPEDTPQVFTLPEKYSIPVRPGESAPAEPNTANVSEQQKVVADEPVAKMPEKLAVTEKQVVNSELEKVPPAPTYQILVGPFVSKSTLEAATLTLREMGYQPQLGEGRGMVPMIRLVEGTYPAEEARERLAVLKKKVKSAFILPNGEKRTLYAASFYDADRAEKLLNSLATKGVRLTAVHSELEMEGKLLFLNATDQASAEQAAAAISNAGLRVQLTPQ